MCEARAEVSLGLCTVECMFRSRYIFDANGVLKLLQSIFSPFSFVVHLREKTVPNRMPDDLLKKISFDQNDNEMITFSYKNMFRMRYGAFVFFPIFIYLQQSCRPSLAISHAGKEPDDSARFLRPE